MKFKHLIVINVIKNVKIDMHYLFIKLKATLLILKMTLKT
ncbi:hypothetical protein CCP3SC1AL1_2720002 [Gammaproteobacteria bacterium]